MEPPRRIPAMPRRGVSMGICSHLGEPCRLCVGGSMSHGADVDTARCVPTRRRWFIAGASPELPIVTTATGDGNSRGLRHTIEVAIVCAPFFEMILTAPCRGCILRLEIVYFSTHCVPDVDVMSPPYGVARRQVKGKRHRISARACISDPGMVEAGECGAPVSAVTPAGENLSRG